MNEVRYGDSWKKHMEGLAKKFIISMFEDVAKERDSLYERLKASEEVMKKVYVQHTQKAVSANFNLCGCDYCYAYRKAFETGGDTNKV